VNQSARRWYQFVPARYAHIAFAFLLSGTMTAIVSAVATVRNLGLDALTFDRWFRAFSSAWPVTFPCVLVLAPLVRRTVGQFVVAASPERAAQVRKD
jgi:hypothetical protein